MQTYLGNFPFLCAKKCTDIIKIKSFPDIKLNSTLAKRNLRNTATYISYAIMLINLLPLILYACICIWLKKV